PHHAHLSPLRQDSISLPPARSVLPEDWDREFHSFAASAAAPEVMPAPPMPSSSVPPLAPAATVPPSDAIASPTPASTPIATAPDREADLMAAFLRGIGVADLRPGGDPAAAMEALGAA